jgi:hypothetical protein
MRTSQLLIHEPDGRLTALLEGVKAPGGEKPCLVRHPRTLPECLAMLRPGDAAVLVVRLAGNVEEELALVAGVAQLHPDVGIVVVGEAVHAPLVGLAWDLGADQVLILPQSRELLTETVAGLLRPAGA